MGHIFFIMWISWAWKWTLIKNLKALNLENLLIPLSYKTRNIRDNEINWVDRYFISKESFFWRVQNWEFLEYAKVHDLDFYWTKLEDVVDKWINLWKIVLKEIDIIWLKELKINHPELDLKYTTIFLNIPIEILNQRIEKRWVFMSDSEFENRLNSAKNEIFESKNLCDFIIDASKSETEVLNDVLSIIKNKSYS